MSDKFDGAEFLRVLDRVAEDEDLADWSNPKPRLDSKLRKDVRDDAVRGDRIERYKQALESVGMVLVPPQALGAWNNGQPHTEPLWIHPDYALQIAFSEDDILTLFKGDSGPQELHEWVTDKQRRLAARRAGIVLPHS